MKIDKEQIKSFIKQLPYKMWQGIKTVYGLPHSGKYILLSILLIIIFLLITFPYDLFILKKIYGLERRSLQSISLPVFKFSIFGDTVIENPAIILNNGDEITCEKTTIATPNPISLLLSKKIKSHFTIDLLKFYWKESELLITSSHGNFELYLDKQTYMPTSGSIQIGVINTVLKHIKIPIKTQLGPIHIERDSIIINSEKIECTIANSILKINKFETKGDIASEISGSINLLSKKLDLTIEIDIDNEEFRKYRDFIPSKFVKNDRITLKVDGTTDKPDPNLIEKNKDEN